MMYNTSVQEEIETEAFGKLLVEKINDCLTVVFEWSGELRIIQVKNSKHIGSDVYTVEDKNTGRTYIVLLEKFLLAHYIENSENIIFVKGPKWNLNATS